MRCIDGLPKWEFHAWGSQPCRHASISRPKLQSVRSSALPMRGSTSWGSLAYVSSCVLEFTLPQVVCRRRAGSTSAFQSTSSHLRPGTEVLLPAGLHVFLVCVASCGWRAQIWSSLLGRCLHFCVLHWARVETWESDDLFRPRAALCDAPYVPARNTLVRGVSNHLVLFLAYSALRSSDGSRLRRRRIDGAVSQDRGLSAKWN